jgi:Saxitoxin biosynthesis operon protein SxtJ
LTDDRHSTPAMERRSTLTVVAVLALIAGWSFYRGHQIRFEIVAALAGILFVVAFVPPAARIFHRYWMGLAHVLGAINSRIILSLLYFLVITPVGSLVRWSGHDPLRRRTQRSTSYWVPRPQPRQTRAEFEKTF